MSKETGTKHLLLMHMGYDISLLYWKQVENNWQVQSFKLLVPSTDKEQEVFYMSLKGFLISLKIKFNWRGYKNEDKIK